MGEVSERGRGKWGLGRAEVSVGPLPFGLRLSIALRCDAFVPIFLSLSLSHSDFPLNRWRNEFLLGRTKELSLGRARQALTGLQFHCGMWRLNLVRIDRFGQPVKQSIGYGVCIED